MNLPSPNPSPRPPSKPIFEPHEVRSFIHRKFGGLTVEDFLEVGFTMVGSKRSATSNDVPSAGGQHAFNNGVRRLREVAAPRGWVKCADNFFHCILQPELSLKIGVMNTDAGTGLEDGDGPSNKSRKGAACDRIVAENQTFFGDIMEAASNVIQMANYREDGPIGLRPAKDEVVTVGPVETWLLCVYCTDEDFRIELSRPSKFNGRFFTEFSERVLIYRGEDKEGDGPNPTRRPVDIEPPIITVLKKRA